MHRHRIDGSRAAKTTLGLAFALALAAGQPAAAGTSWDYPLLPHVKALAFMPSQPSDDQPVSVVLSSTWMGECWSAGEITVIDSANVSLDVTACPLPTDTLSGWVREAQLGVLHAGMHSLTIRALVTTVAGTTAEEITIPYEVVHAQSPPPPPADSGFTRIVAIDVEPSSPKFGDAVSVTWRGLAPYNCMQISDAAVVDESHLAMTLLRTGACADTTRLWEQRFDLGVPTVGSHYFDLDIAVDSLGGTTHVHSGAGFFVSDPNAPPPPPPGDSLKTVLSATHPNPFSDLTRFSVSLKDPVQAQVAVYDLGGRRIVTVFSGLLQAGTSEMAWNGRRGDGSRAPGGIYFYRLTLPGRVVTRRVVLLTTP